MNLFSKQFNLEENNFLVILIVCETLKKTNLLESREKKKNKNMVELTCFICAVESPKYWAVTECGHAVCSLCALRMRLLYEKNYCLMCKTDAAKTVFVPASEYKSLFASTSVNYSLLFSQLAQRSLLVNYMVKELSKEASSVELLFFDESTRLIVLKPTQMLCPIPDCSEAKHLWPTKETLKKHISSSHEGLTLCSICLTHKKVFPGEFKTLTRQQLLKHQRGEDLQDESARASKNIKSKLIKTPNTAKHKIFRGHPSCSLCKNSPMFYSEDELRNHLRDRHESCHICMRGRPRGDLNYEELVACTHHFVDYEALETHFRASHFLCPERLCLDLKFIVFADELELKAHLAQVHSDSFLSGSSRGQRSTQMQLRRLDISFGGPSSSSTSGNTLDTPNNGRNPRDEKSTRQNTSNRNSYPKNQKAGVEKIPLTTDEMPQIDSTILLYGKAMIPMLAGRIQSMSLYEQRNREMLRSLSDDYGLSQEQVSTVHGLCLSYQNGRLGALLMVTQLHALLGGSTNLLQAITRPLADLQLDPVKRRQFEIAVNNRVTRIATFPPLPSLPANTQVSSKHSSKTKLSRSNEATGDSLTLGISRLSVTGQKNDGRHHSNVDISTRQVPSVSKVIRIKSTVGNLMRPIIRGDPSRDPMVLLGGSLGTSDNVRMKTKSFKNEKVSVLPSSSLDGRFAEDKRISSQTQRRPPSFVQAATNTSAVGPTISSVMVLKGGVLGQNDGVDGSKFTGAKSTNTIGSLGTRPNVFTTGENRDTAESIMMGTSTAADPEPDPKDMKVFQKDKRKNRVTIMKYG